MRELRTAMKQRTGLIVVLLLLASVGTASADGTWVLWEDNGYSTRQLERFNAEPACQTAALREARETYIRESGMSARRRRGDFGVPHWDGNKVQIPVEFETLTISYDCLPDTIDPRGPKTR